MNIDKYFQIVLLWCLNCVTISISSPLPGEGISLMDFLMASSAKNVQRISFGPDDGLRYRENYEKKYGPRGKHLVAMLGQGDVDVASSGYFTFGKNRDKAKAKRYSPRTAHSKTSSPELPETSSRKPK